MSSRTIFASKSIDPPPFFFQIPTVLPLHGTYSRWTSFLPVIPAFLCNYLIFVILLWTTRTIHLTDPVVCLCLFETGLGWSESMPFNPPPPISPKNKDCKVICPITMICLIKPYKFVTENRKFAPSQSQ